MENRNVFLSLSENLNEKLSALNIKEPTAVQKEIIPLISQGEDVVFQSETGTGKTFAYLLPLINKLEQETDSTKLRILVVAPTFELASQINMNVKTVTNRKSALIIGGAPIKRQLETLKEKPQIICGSVARIVELIRLKKIKINDLFAIVFDETDRLVKKELLEETNELYNLIPQSTQIIACTATINQFTKRFFAGIL